MSFSAAAQSSDPLANPTKPVVLIFVRISCPVSSRYAPAIQELAARYQGRADFWLVYPDPADDDKAITENLRQFGYKLPWIRDPRQTLAAKAHATITPEAVVYNASGREQYHGRIDNLYESFGRARRAATTHELDDALAAVVAGKSAPVRETKAIGCYIADLK